MKRLIALWICLLALCAGATNITNYPVRTTFDDNYWFLLSDVAAQTNWNLPGGYVASTAELNSASNTLWTLANQAFTNSNFTNIYVNLQYVTNQYVTTNNTFLSYVTNEYVTKLTVNTNYTDYDYVTNVYAVTQFVDNSYVTNLYVTTNITVRGRAYFNETYITNLTVVYGLTNLNLTTNSLVATDAGDSLTSVYNGAGLLENDGFGGFSWVPLSALTNGQVTYYITTNTYNWSTNYINNDTYVSNYFTTNVFLDTYMSNFYQTNFYTTNNTWSVTTNNEFYTFTTNIVFNTPDNYVSNYFITNFFMSSVTNYYYWSTNVYLADTYVSNYFTTNVFLDTYVSNFFLTNLFSTNQYYTTYITNLYTTPTYISNFFSTNILVTDNYVSNYFITNILENYTTTNIFINSPDTYVSNYFTTNITYWTTNNTFTTITTNIYGITNAFILDKPNVTAYGMSNTFLGDVSIYGTLYLYNTNPTTTLSNLHVGGWSQLDGQVTNLTLTANTVLKANSGKGIASIANGTGVLTNDGSGGVGWIPVAQVVSTNYLPLAGGTETGAVLSTSSSTNAPAQNEFPVAGWVRGLFNNGVIDYSTANTDVTATNTGSGQVMYTFASTIPPASSRTYTAPVAGDYIGSVMTTNTFTFLQGPIDVSAYIAAIGGAGSPSVSLHPEIYYSYDKTNWIGDWQAANQTITIGSTNHYQFVVTFPAITSTNANGFYLQRRYKIGTATGATHPNVVFLIGTNGVSGTNDASHIAFSGPSSQSGNAYLFNTQTFTGTNTFSEVVNVVQESYSTNLSTMAPDFAKAYGWIGTNAAFSFLAPLNVPSDRTPTCVVIVTNSTGSAILATMPANVHLVPGSTPYVTNATAFTFHVYPPFCTNCYAVPLW